MSTPRPAVPSLGRATALVAEREILAQIRTKSFLISTAVLLVLILAGIVASAVVGGDDDGTKVAVVTATQDVVAASDGLEPVLVEDADAALALVEQEEVSAAVLPGDGPTGVRLVALDSEPSDVVAALSLQPQVELLDPADLSENLRFVVALAFGLVFMMSAVGSGNMIAQNTVQEKQSRIVEILLSAVPARALLAGKVLGNSVVAVGQTAAIAAVSVIGLVVTGQEDLLQVLGAPIVWFVAFFLIGFVLLASMFAASASLVSRLEDVGAVLQPVLWLTMIPYFLVVFFTDNETVMTVTSYVPFSAPVSMPVRLFFGEALWWEPLVSLVVLVVTTGLVIVLAARIYSGSLLRTGARVPLRAALAAAKG
ncbi:ABC transporter permease [Cellulomonas soli]|uniref:ABC transporter permease n=1 Tax=Cellulomonas soli TaxID=931535 RepID=UPI003F85DC99